MRYLKVLAVFALVACVTFAGAGAGWADDDGNEGWHRLPKYVFFFLGDGMASTHVQATEAFLTTVNGGSAKKAEDLLRPENRLNMSKLAYAGMQTTFDSFALMTDSASAGTAFASGLKTASSVINMDSSKTIGYKSVAQLAKEMGMKVGVVTSVSLDHATPAAYYASVPSRSDMHTIAKQMADSGYEFFGGGGLVKPVDGSSDVWALLSANGYQIRNTRPDIMNLMSNPRDKVVCINPWLQDAAAMPYAIDSKYVDTDLSLAEMTRVAIANLYGGNKGKGNGKGTGSDRGFFIMVEGGKIDWASHANDAMATIGDMLDFDAAVGEALEFYKKHPKETLIVVTGDHETGGMSIGHATTGYTAYYDRLLGQKYSFQYFGQNQWPQHKAAKAGTVCNGTHLTNSANMSADNEMKALMLNVFGLDYSTLNEDQKAKLELAYDKSMCGSNVNDPDMDKSKNTLLFGGYEPIIVTITHILNERASIGWTSYSHTGVPVPVFAEGQQAWRFSGFYDNTDIAKQLAKAIGYAGELPVMK